MFGFSICKYISAKRLADRIERIHDRYPGNHLPPKKIVCSVLGAIDITDGSNWSSLHYSAYLGLEVICVKLITNGADINMQNASGDTPLQLACRMENLSCIEVILQFEPKINIQNNELRTPLLTFISRPPRNEYMLEKLLRAGANPNIADEYGYSALQALAIQVATDKTKTFARLLVRYRANVDSETRFGQTPLHFAVDSRNMGLMEVLLESGASINIPDKAGKTAMDIALEKKTRFPQVFDLLAKHIIIQYCCGFKVNVKYLEKVCENEDYQNFKKNCEEEILVMKSTFVGDSIVTHYDILVWSTNKVARCLFNPDILASLAKFKKGSSILGSLLWKRYRAGLRRYHVMKLGDVATRWLFPFLPDPCVDKLLEYLHNDDFSSLYRAYFL